MRCIYALPEEGCAVADRTSPSCAIEEIADFTRRAAQAGIRRVRLTGGEPLVRKGVVDLVREIAATPESRISRSRPMAYCFPRWRPI